MSQVSKIEQIGHAKYIKPGLNEYTFKVHRGGRPPETIKLQASNATNAKNAAEAMYSDE